MAKADYRVLTADGRPWRLSKTWHTLDTTTVPDWLRSSKAGLSTFPS